MPTSNSSNYDNIPQELKELKQWILWRYVQVEGSQKPTKVPYQTNGNKASDTDTSHWSSFNDVVRIVKDGRGYDGIGFVFSKTDEYAGIDLDDCEGNQVDFQRQLKIYNEFDSYSERSPSGNGCHIIIKGSLPQGRRRSHIEIYSQARYFTMTGNVVNNKPIADRHDLLNQLFNQMGGNPQSIAYTGNEPETEDDKSVVEKASNASNGDKFQQLFRGEWQGLYPSQSEADLALIDIIAFYTQNRNQISRLFRASGLGKRNKAERQDYLNYMIQKSFDRLLPQIDVDGFRIALEAKIAERKADEQLEMPLGPVAQSVEPTAHNSLVAGSSPVGTTNIQPPPGLTGAIARFIYEAAPRPVPEIAIAAALGFMAGICGKAYNISNTGLNLYVLLLAPTGTGKEAMASGIDRIINAVGLSVPVASEFVGPSEIQSGQALIKNLAENNSYVSILGEFGLRLRAMSSEKANGAEIALRRMLLDLYNKSGYGQVVRPTIYSDKAKNVASIAAPAFSILGESTPERFYETLTEEMISEGLLPRFTIIEYNGSRPANNTNAMYVQPDMQLVDMIATLMATAKTTIANRAVIHVQADPEANKLLTDFDKYADARINNTEREVVRQLWNRAHIKVMKIAALLAVGVNYQHPIITTDLVVWAKDVVENEIHALQKKFESGTIGKNSDEQKQVDDFKRVIKSYVMSDFDKISKYPGAKQMLHSDKIIPHSYLSNRVGLLASFKNDRIGGSKALERTIKLMLDGGLIAQLSHKQLEKYSTVAKCYVVTDMSAF